MITFSFRPRSGSDFAEMAASVSTRVVSWKEAADSHESVASDAFVIPSSSGRALAGTPPLSTISAFFSSNARRGHHVAGQELRVARLDDVHLAQHLTRDQLDVLVVDRDALAPVHLLDLVHQVLLEREHALDPQLLVRVHRTLGELLADLDRRRRRSR